MMNETQEVAFQNLLILGEDHGLKISLHGLTIDDAVELATKLMGGQFDRPQITKSTIDGTFVVTAEIEGTKTEITIFCLPLITATPFGEIRASDEVDAEEVMRRDG